MGCGSGVPGAQAGANTQPDMTTSTGSPTWQFANEASTGDCHGLSIREMSHSLPPIHHVSWPAASEAVPAANSPKAFPQRLPPSSTTGKSAHSRERWRCTTRWWRQALPKRGAANQGQEHGESCHENPPHRGVVRTRFARAHRPFSDAPNGPSPFVPAASGHVRGTCLRPSCRAEVFSRRR